MTIYIGTTPCNARDRPSGSNGHPFGCRNVHDTPNHNGNNNSSGKHHDHLINSSAVKAFSGVNVNVTPFQAAALVALGALVFPATVGAVASATMTAMMIGPISEVFILEAFLDASLVQMAARAGLVSAAGKLNLFGLFGKAKVVDHSARNIIITHKMSWQEVSKMAIDNSVATGVDQLLLYSRLGDGLKLSQDFARSNGLKTLEMTPGGRWLTNLDLWDNPIFSQMDTLQIWKTVSLEAARIAKGRVRSIVGSVDQNSIYAAEKAMIDKNPGAYIDEMCILPVIRPKR